MSANVDTQVREKVKIAKPSLFKVVLYNDNVTPYEFVLTILMGVYNKSEEQATKIVNEIHSSGKGVAGIYTEEVAETKVADTKAWSEQYGFPLVCKKEVA